MELQIITQDEIKTASTVLATTKSWVSAYAKKEAALIILADKDGVKLSVETDSAINDFLASLKKASKTANEARAPFTRRLDEIKSLFTAEENALKSMETVLQNKRNASVKIYTQEKAEQDRLAQLKLDQEKARIELLAEAESQIRSQYAKELAADRELLLGAFEGATLENITAVEEMLAGVVGEFSKDTWDGFTVTLDGAQSGLSEQELAEIAIKAKEGKFEKVAPHYQSEIKGYADYLLALITERKKELEEGKASAAAEILRKEQEAAALAQEQQNEQRKEDQVKAQTNNAVATGQIEQAYRAMSVPNAKAIEAYSITVEGQQGWSEIFKFYSTHCEKEMTAKTTLGSMLIFAEAEAKRNGTVIESEFLHYEATYKAVTKAKRVA